VAATAGGGGVSGTGRRSAKRAGRKTFYIQSRPPKPPAWLSHPSPRRHPGDGHRGQPRPCPMPSGAGPHGRGLPAFERLPCSA
jgi:hypothetical protein